MKKDINMPERLKNRILAARKEIASDLVLKGGNLLNVFSCETYEADIAIYDGVIVGTGTGYRGNTEIDIRGKWVTPGLVDGHLHIESSMLVPSMLAPELLSHGTTTIVSDPHEIANVLGMDGIRFMLDDSSRIPMDIFFMAPSCVPSTHLETSGAVLDVSSLSSLTDEPRILGLAEMMNFPGVLSGDRDVMEKIALFQDKIIDGHSPGMTGSDLQAYISAGIRSDHESTDRSEGILKIKNGMILMIREGTSAKNMADLLPLVNSKNARRCCLVSDDLHPLDLEKRGHLDFALKKAVSLGLDAATAVQLVTLNPSEYFGLKNIGAIAPGYKADIAVFNDMKDFEIDKVYKNGDLVVDGGKPVYLSAGETKRHIKKSWRAGGFRVSPVSLEDLRIPYTGKKVRVINVVPGQIITKASIETPKEKKGDIVSDIESDILKLCVVERHKGTGNIGLGLVKGLGLARGAIASSVAHDSHNIIAAGVRDEEILLSINTVKEMAGGQVVVCGDTILAQLPLEVAGLMSACSFEEMVRQVESLKKAASDIGCSLDDPFMLLSFLALPVIPELKLTDRGLIDVERFEIVDLYC